MINVTARKIRDHSQGGGGPEGLGRVYTGYLVSYPVVGRGMVIFRDPHGHRMVTTPIRRVMGEPEGNPVFVETDNSVYRLELGEEIAPARESSSEAASSA